MNISLLLKVLGLFLFALSSQLIPRPPNFACLNAVALFAPIFLNGRSRSFATLFAIVFCNDLLFGYHSTMPFVYLSLGFIALMGDTFKNRMSFQRLPLACLAASLLFFLVTNFGTWLTSSLYPKTLDGFGLCYLAALPFFGNQIMGDLFFGFMFYSIRLLEPVKNLKCWRFSAS